MIVWYIYASIIGGLGLLLLFGGTARLTTPSPKSSISPLIFAALLFGLLLAIDVGLETSVLARIKQWMLDHLANWPSLYNSLESSFLATHFKGAPYQLEIIELHFRLILIATLALAYFVARTALRLIEGIAGFVMKPFSKEHETLKQHELWSEQPGLKSMGLGLFAGLLLAMLLGPLLIWFVTIPGAQLDHLLTTTALAFGNFGWLGALILTGEVALLLHEPPQRQSSMDPKPSSETNEEEKGLDLRQLLRQMVHEYGRRHLAFAQTSMNAATQRPECADANSPPPHNDWTSAAARFRGLLLSHYCFSEFNATDAAQSVDAFLNTTTNANLVLGEPLSQTCIELIGEISRDTQDQGRLSLIICPSHDCEELHYALEHRKGVPADGLNQTGKILESSNSNFSDNALYTYLIVRDSDIEQLFVDKFEALPDWAANLGLIACVNIQDTEATMLRLAISRLWRSTSALSTKVFCQGYGVDDVEALSGAIFLRKNFSQLRLNDPSQRNRHFLIWRASQNMCQDLAKEQLRASTSYSDASVIANTPIWSKGYETCNFNPFGHYDQDAHRKTVNMVMECHSNDLNANLTVDAARNSKSVSASFSAFGQAHVACYEDHGNLLLAVHRPGILQARSDQLISLVSYEWPLRDFLVAAFKAQTRHLSFGTQDGVGSVIAPRPQGGIKELLNSLGKSLQRKDGIPVEEITQGFSTLLPRELAQVLGASPGLVGLERLYQRVTGTHERLHLRRIIRKKNARYVTGSIPDDALSFDIPVIFSGQRNHPVTHVRRADIGLTILPYQRILLNSQRHSIEGIEPGHIIVGKGETSYEPQIVHPTLHYRLRSFKNGDSQNKSFAREQEVLSNEFGSEYALDIAHLHLSYTRETTGYYFHSRLQAPGTNNKAYTTLSGPLTVTVNQDFQNALVLRLIDRRNEDCDPTIGFALAVLLQDVARTLAPYRYARGKLWAACPQASSLRQEIWQSAGSEPIDDLHRVITRIYPVIDPETTRKVLNEVWRTVPEKCAIYELILFEDSDHDLGIIRAFRAKSHVAMGWMQSVAEWIVENDSVSQYHRFGTDLDPEIINFEGASALLKEMTGSQFPKIDAASAKAPPLTNPSY